MCVITPNTDLSASKGDILDINLGTSVDDGELGYPTNTQNLHPHSDERAKAKCEYSCEIGALPGTHSGLSYALTSVDSTCSNCNKGSHQRYYCVMGSYTLHFLTSLG